MQNNINKYIIKLLIFFMGFIVGVMLLNYFNNSSFLQINLYQVLHLLFFLIASVYFAYYLTQKKNDERNIIILAEDIIIKILRMMEHRKEAIFKEIGNIGDVNSRKKILIFLKEINFKITLLKRIGENMKFTNEINDIYSTFMKMKTLITGDGWSLIDSLTDDTKMEIDKNYTNILNKLDDLRVSIYL
jgi:hypothetical protein